MAGDTTVLPTRRHSIHNGQAFEEKLRRQDGALLVTVFRKARIYIAHGWVFVLGGGSRAPQVVDEMGLCWVCSRRSGRGKGR